MAPEGRDIKSGPLSTERVANGLGRLVTRILWTNPGRCWSALVNTPEGSGGAVAVEGRQLKKMAAKTKTATQVSNDFCIRLKAPKKPT